jgi:hypothetical protein
MSQIRIDNQKAMKKWSPVLENMGVSGEKLEWMAEYAEFHSINENAYVNATNVAGMGNVLSAQPGAYAGNTLGVANGGTYPSANVGSGDVGQNLLPVAMKIAAQTIGLDLVAVKPTPGPKLDLLFIDFQYDDVNLDSNERPQVFKLATTTANAALTAIIATTSTIGGVTNVATQNQGGLLQGRIFLNIATSSVTSTGLLFAEPAKGARQNWVEFLGFSRIDGYPMFRAFRQANTAGQFNSFAFETTNNTFNSTTAMNAQILFIAGVAQSLPEVQLISALEDHIPGFSANWAAQPVGQESGAYPMSRLEDDNSYSGVIGPKISSKTIAVGTIEISSALRRTEIEDIKANTGMDIVQKMESILVNELSQTISKQIVAKIFEIGDLNRTSAPASGATYSNNISSQTQLVFEKWRSRGILFLNIPWYICMNNKKYSNYY